MNDANVQGGKIALSHLPFADGQRVRVVVAESNEPTQKLPIQKVREFLKGGVERFDDPFEPMISGENWEMLK